MGEHWHLKYFLIAIILKYSNGYRDGCNRFVAKNVGSLNATFLSSLIDPIKDKIPVFNEKTVPNLPEIIDDFNEGTSSEDIFLNITQILTKYGYESEQHTVQTSDGYLLDIFRIPGKGPVVFIMHGILCSSDSFTSTGPAIGLPYLLADLGYDVWIGNARGTEHGRRHVTLSPDCKEFWQFSWDEIGRYDVPASIDYILDKTKQKKLAYIGHSQGTTTYFVMTSEFPEYNNKISVMIALSPVSYLSHTQNPILPLLSRPIAVEDALLSAIGLYEFFPRNPLTSALTTIACGTEVTATIFCNNLAFLFVGADYGQINARILPAFYGHYPAGCGTLQLIHFAQLINTGRFCQMDHGTFENLARYGTARPPDYRLEKITSKIVVFTSDNDVIFSAPADREKLIARLPNVVEQYRVPYAKFAHMDYLFARDVRELAYDKIVEVLSDYA
ncbi:lipase 3-like [Plodia interpunctella]|uniref:lipase 3-like n=1 Tax=Plodia interpunctella TaxID=58824 RepID=UPI002368AD30|nr:lipase 3-like [Plodia interpunctella]